MTADRNDPTTGREGLLDRLLDRAIAPGYSAVGYALRRPFWHGGDAQPDALTGNHVLVTGASGGIGAAIALGLARRGADVHLLARSEESAAAARRRIVDTLSAGAGSSARLHAHACDVSDLAEVKRFGGQLLDQLPAAGLHAIVHNAGVMPEQRKLSAQGHELTLATHVLGPLLMTELLRPALRRDGDARVVLMSSGGMYTTPLVLDDIEYESGEYRGATAYARTKRMQVELAPLLARRWSADTAVYAMHPGWVDTPGINQSLPRFVRLTRPLLRTPEAGADTAIFLTATEPAPPSGSFWHDRTQRPFSYFGLNASTTEQRQRLLSRLEELLALSRPR